MAISVKRGTTSQPLHRSPILGPTHATISGRGINALVVATPEKTGDLMLLSCALQQSAGLQPWPNEYTVALPHLSSVVDGGRLTGIVSRDFEKYRLAASGDETTDLRAYIAIV